MSSDESQDRRAQRGRKLIGRAVNDAVARAPFVWPLLKAPMRNFFDRAARGWDERTRAGSVEHLAAFAAGLLHVSPAPERALDIGTGTGEAALLLAREFPQARVRGIDLSAEMIALAKAKVGLDPEGRVAFKVADASDLPWEAESFDLVAQLNMPPYFAETARVLRPGGTVLVASSWGQDTPFYTPDPVLTRKFARHRIILHTTGGAAEGSYWVGRKQA